MGDVFWNNHWSGRIIVGADVGVEAEAGASAALGESYTWVKVINGWFGIQARAARGVFGLLRDLALPSGLDPQSTLSKAESVANKHRNAGGSGCGT
jgi:hypothetical protein